MQIISYVIHNLQKNLKTFRFLEKDITPDTDYVYFQNSIWCRSKVGKKVSRKKQPIRVGACKSFGQIAHEIMHKLGKLNPINRT